jgi:hypothetical protein
VPGSFAVVAHDDQISGVVGAVGQRLGATLYDALMNAAPQSPSRLATNPGARRALTLYRARGRHPVRHIATIDSAQDRVLMHRPVGTVAPSRRSRRTDGRLSGGAVPIGVQRQFLAEVVVFGGLVGYRARDTLAVIVVAFGLRYG